MQIAALYLYYALYHKQPVYKFVKMRITLADSEKLLEFSRLLKARPQQYGQPLLILSKLLSESGFLLVTENEEYLRVQNYKNHSLASIPDIPNFEPLNLRLEMDDVFDPDEGLLTRMEMLEIAYNEMKEVLGKDDPNLAAKNICSTVKQSLNKVALILNKTTEFPIIAPFAPSVAEKTSRERILEKITALQQLKNTLPCKQEKRDEPGPSSKRFRLDAEVIKEEEDKIQIDLSFMSVPQEKTTKSYAQREIEDENNKSANVKATAIKRKKRGKK